MVRKRRFGKHKVKFHKSKTQDGVRWRFECSCGAQSQFFENKELCYKIGNIHDGAPWEA